MGYLRFFIFTVCFGASAVAAHALCWSPVVDDISVSQAEPTRLKLEASRVAGLAERGFLYNLGRERVVIRTDSIASERFLQAVLSGVCTVTVDVVLIPAGDSRDHRIYATRLARQQPRAVAAPPTSATSSP